MRRVGGPSWTLAAPLAALLATACGDGSAREPAPSGATLTPVAPPVVEEPAAQEAPATDQPGAQEPVAVEGSERAEPVEVAEEAPAAGEAAPTDTSTENDGTATRARTKRAAPARRGSTRPRAGPPAPDSEECRRARSRAHSETICDAEGNCWSPGVPPGCSKVPVD